MYFDFTYLLFMLPALVFGLVAQAMVKSRYKKYSAVATRRGVTGVQSAQEVMRQNGVSGVGIGAIAGELTDNYNPQTNSISLSQGVYNSTSVAAVGIAAHEAGHAVQYAKNYSPVKFRMAIIPVCNFGARFAPLLIIFGALLAGAAGNVGYEIGSALYLAGIILFAAVGLFHLVTLPVEINASRRAVRALAESGALESDELAGAKKVLTAAALTYVAALASSIAQLLYYLTRFAPRKK